jgi:hypothetical protein
MRILPFVLLLGCGLTDAQFARGLRAMADTPPEQQDDRCARSESCRWSGNTYECTDACGRRTRTCYRSGSDVVCDQAR